MNIQPFLSEFLATEGIETFSYLPNLILIVLVFLLMWIGKKVFDLLTHYSIEHQLVKADNKAISVAFVGYLAGVAIVIEGILEGGSDSILMELIDVFVWGIIGILLLNLAGKLNDVLIFRQFDNKDELLNKQNIAVGVTVAGSYIGCAIIIRSIIMGESYGWGVDIILTLLYFVIAQIAFFLYSKLYQIVTQYDFHKEIKENNVAAGISVGFNLAAVGVLLAIPLRSSFSILLFLTWFILGSAVMAFFRFIMDRIIIPLEKLDEEIHKDKNWGIALLEGCFSITAIITLQAIFA